MIEHIAILSLTAIAICSTTWPDMIFEKQATAIEKYIGVWLSKPLFGCYICATFWYGLAMSIILGWEWWLCFPAMGLSAVISMLQND